MTGLVSQVEALSIFAEAVNEPVSDLHPDRQRDTIAGWDSMGVLLLMAALDERLGIELSAEESRMMRRVGDYLEFLRKRGMLQG